MESAANASRAGRLRHAGTDGGAFDVARERGGWQNTKKQGGQRCGAVHVERSAARRATKRESLTCRNNVRRDPPRSALGISSCVFEYVDF